MTLEERRLVKRMGRVLLVAMFIAVGSVISLGFSNLSSSAAFSPGHQQENNFNANMLVATSALTYYLYLPIVHVTDNSGVNSLKHILSLFY